MQNLKKKHNLPYSTLTKFRYIFILVIIIEELIFWTNLNFRKALFVKSFFLTEWAHSLTLIFYVIMVTKKYDKKRTSKLSFIFHLALSLQFLIVIVYWIFLHKILLEKTKNKFIIFICYSKHILPPFFLLIDLFLNNVVLIDRMKFHFYFIFWYGVMLMFMDFVLGVNIYPIFDFEGPRTYFALLACCAFLLFCQKMVLKVEKFKYVCLKVKR